ncbi:unnamed protein product, partial [Brassica oleracea var. botrytis]
MLRYCSQHHIQSLTENSNTDGIGDLCNYFSFISIGKKRKEKKTSERCVCPGNRGGEKAHKKIKKKKKHNRIYIYMKELSLAFLLLTATTR